MVIKFNTTLMSSIIEFLLD